MTDSLDTLSTAIGLPRKQLEEIAARVKANHAKLEACAWHEFTSVPLAFGQSSLRQRYECRRCGGEIDRQAHYWHEKGRRLQDAESGGRAA